MWKGILAGLAPHRRAERIQDIAPEGLAALGVKGLLLDLDCTLMDHGAAVLPAATFAWVEQLRGAQIKMCILSNGSARRVEPMANALGLPCVCRAAKPLTFGLRAAMGKLDLEARSVAVVGDQLFTDVLVGRLVGAYTILVKHTTNVEPWTTRIKRPLERMVLRRLDDARAPPWRASVGR